MSSLYLRKPPEMEPMKNAPRVILQLDQIAILIQQLAVDQEFKLKVSGLFQL